MEQVVLRSEVSCSRPASQVGISPTFDKHEEIVWARLTPVRECDKCRRRCPLPAFFFLTTQSLVGLTFFNKARNFAEQVQMLSVVLSVYTWVCTEPLSATWLIEAVAVILSAAGLKSSHTSSVFSWVYQEWRSPLWIAQKESNRREERCRDWWT